MNQTLARFHAEGASRFVESTLLRIPFFKDIRPAILKLSETEATVEMPHPTETRSSSERDTSDDAALCSLALFAGGLLADASEPLGARWSLKGFTVEYLKLREFGVHALANAALIDWSKAGDYSLPVSIVQHVNHQAELVATATLKISVEMA
ncbi:MAG: DUF4442 domain-containing protein [Burkholderiaceae bacterium]